MKISPLQTINYLSMRKGFWRLWLVVLSSVGLLFSSTCFAMFHDEYWAYYFQNQKTWEIRQIMLSWDMWSGLFNQLNDSSLDTDSIPVKNYYSGWDFIGYNYNLRHAYITCKWDDGILQINTLDQKLDTPNIEKSPCRKIGFNYSSLQLSDLSILNKIQYFLRSGVVLFFPFFLGVIFYLVSLLPLSKIRWLQKLTKMKILLILTILAIILQIQISHLVFDEIEKHGYLGGGLTTLFIFMLSAPFYLWWAIIFFKQYFAEIKSLFFKRPLNKYASFLLGTWMFFFFMWGGLQVRTWLQIGVAFLVVLAGMLAYYFREHIARVFKKNGGNDA